MRLILIFLFLSICSFAESQEAVEKNVQFLSYPEKVLVTITDRKDKAYVKSCITPCKLNLDRKRKLIFLGTKEGYKNSDKSGAYDTNSLNSVLSLFEDPSFAQATPAIRITLLPLENPKLIDTDKTQLSLLEQCQNHSEPEGFVRPIPIKTKAPKMPKRAKNSGHCKMKYNINPDGNVIDIRATICTDKMYKKPSIKSLKGWKYEPPKNPNGTNYYCNLENKISYSHVNR